ncbi:MAG: colicin V synthesis protein [Arcobacter sp.]|uniref:CvpA family protein n=1 Tax=uncultured Arcobacter sp. TaxID=165434 RepID=UPI000CACA12E|nr:CvpA family protein [uncultured Arcobacter sp.]PLY09231.1 MAG: colicin V synthesis protein [Arcobacter sp.]
MQEFSTFDMIVVGISVVLGLKGLFKGFIKEVFGLVGIIGGIFIASRMSEVVGNLIKPIIGIQSNATLSLIGFVATLIGFWILVYILGSILSKITEMSGLGAVNRLLGFIFGTAKIFLIISVIVYALFQIESFKSTLNEKFSKSLVFPYLVKTGGFIVKLDTSKFMPAKNDEPVKKEQTEVKETTSEEEVLENTPAPTEEPKETLGDKITESTSEAVKKVKETASEIIKDTLTKPAEEK